MTDMRELIKEELSKVLREKRKIKDWTQDEAAEKCGRSRREYEKLENCECLPATDTLINLKLMYDINLEEFIKDLVAKGYSIDDRSCTPNE